MPTFKLTIVRKETYRATVEVEAETKQQAIEQTEDRLLRFGWDAVCDNEGDYEDCSSWVAKEWIAET